MLHKFLKRIARGQPVTIAGLAAELDTTPGMVTLLAEQLVALGYLQESSPSTCLPDSTSPAHCAGCSGCLLAAPQRLWSVTEKGRQAAK